jgi:hypothetical protein
MQNIEYTHSDMEKMARVISKIKKKQHLQEIKKIIKNNNPELSITKNSYGLFMYFHNLTPVTYQLLDKFIKKITAKKSDSDALSSEYVPYSHTEYPFEGNSKLKYSNKEKNLIKKKDYDHQLKKENAEVVESATSDLFIKKSKN